jgi:hypothetical protein
LATSKLKKHSFSPLWKKLRQTQKTLASPTSKSVTVRNPIAPYTPESVETPEALETFKVLHLFQVWNSLELVDDFAFTFSLDHIHADLTKSSRFTI